MALVAVAALAVSTASPAQAWWRGGWGPGIGLGLLGGAIVGGAIANSYYPYGGYYGPGYGYYGPGYAGAGYMAGPPHDLGGPVKAGPNECWSDRDPWSNTGQGYWKARTRLVYCTNWKSKAYTYGDRYRSPFVTRI